MPYFASRKRAGRFCALRSITSIIWHVTASSLWTTQSRWDSEPVERKRDRKKGGGVSRQRDITLMLVTDPPVSSRVSVTFCLIKAWKQHVPIPRSRQQVRLSKHSVLRKTGEWDPGLLQLAMLRYSWTSLPSTGSQDVWHLSRQGQPTSRSVDESEK